MPRKRKQFCTRGHDTYMHGRSSRGHCNVCRKMYIKKYNQSVKGRATRQRYKTKLAKSDPLHKPQRKKDLTTLVKSCERAMQRKFDLDTFWTTLVKEPLKIKQPISTGPRPSAGAPHNEAAIHTGHSKELQRLAHMATIRTKLDY